jgi:hypothetical protein
MHSDLSLPSSGTFSGFGGPEETKRVNHGSIRLAVSGKLPNDE